MKRIPEHQNAPDGDRGAGNTDQQQEVSNRTAAAAVAQFAVFCIKSDGSHRLFQRYATRDEALLVAARLRQGGCMAGVVGPDEVDLVEGGPR